MKVRILLAEGIGTALLVFFGVGTATLSFGFGTAGQSIAAGIVATALAFGLVLLGLCYAIGPVSGCHVNPAVTMGFLVARRMTPGEAAGYWAAQLAGGIAGAAALFGIFHSTPLYTSHVGLGANGYGAHSIIGANAGGVFAAEVILTCMFVFIVLAATRRAAPAAVAGVAIGLTLALVHIVGIPIDGTSVNPARSLAAAIFANGAALDQVWVFIVAPLVGGALAAGLHALLLPASAEEAAEAEPAVPAPRIAEPPQPSAQASSAQAPSAQAPSAQASSQAESSRTSQGQP